MFYPEKAGGMIDALIWFYEQHFELILGAAYFGTLLVMLAVVLFAPKWKPSPVLVTAVLVTVVNVTFSLVLYDRAVTRADAKIERVSYESWAMTKHLIEEARRAAQ